MNILLINPLCRMPALIPLGLGYVASVLRQMGHKLFLIDLNVEPKSLSVLERELDTLDYEVIGIGGLSTTYNFVKEFSTLAKKIKPKAKIIAGNMVSTANPELLLQNSNVDICVIDEGEETVSELIYKIGDFPILENQIGKLLNLTVDWNRKKDEITHIPGLIRDFYLIKT